MKFTKTLASVAAAAVAVSSMAVSTFAATVWTGEKDLGTDWSEFLTLTTAEIAEFAEGDTITLTYDVRASEPQIQVQDGDWKNIAFEQAEDWGGINLDEDATSIDLVVTAEIAAQLNGFENEWGQILQIKGKNIFLTSVDVTSAEEETPEDDSTDVETPEEDEDVNTEVGETEDVAGDNTVGDSTPSEDVEKPANGSWDYPLTEIGMVGGPDLTDDAWADIIIADAEAIIANGGEDQAIIIYLSELTMKAYLKVAGNTADGWDNGIEGALAGATSPWAEYYDAEAGTVTLPYEFWSKFTTFAIQGQGFKVNGIVLEDDEETIATIENALVNGSWDLPLREIGMVGGPDLTDDQWADIIIADAEAIIANGGEGQAIVIYLSDLTMKAYLKVAGNTADGWDNGIEGALAGATSPWAEYYDAEAGTVTLPYEFWSKFTTFAIQGQGFKVNGIALENDEETIAAIEESLAEDDNTVGESTPVEDDNTVGDSDPTIGESTPVDDDGDNNLDTGVTLAVVPAAIAAAALATSGIVLKKKSK